MENKEINCKSCVSLQKQVTDLVSVKAGLIAEKTDLSTKNTDLSKQVKDFESAVKLSSNKNSFIANGGKADLFDRFNKLVPDFNSLSKKEIAENKELMSGYFDAPTEIRAGGEAEIASQSSVKPEKLVGIGTIKAKDFT